MFMANANGWQDKFFTRREYGTKMSRRLLLTDLLGADRNC